MTLLYYLTGHDTKEIAAFLALPLSTVKNRLHAARKRLRKELWTMAETLIEEEKPSQNDAFAENVLARVLREFQQQEASDPHTANRSLLDEGRTALFQILGETTPLDDQSLRNGFVLLWHKKDWQALSTLLMRYLTQPLSDSETAWAYLHLANTIALGGSAAGAVLAHEAFERWMPGKSPLLSAQWPYYSVSKDTADASYAGDEVRLLFLSMFADFPISQWNLNVWHNSESVEFITSFLKAWYNTDYLAKVDAVLADIPETPRNRRLRFLVLDKAANACGSIEGMERARRYVQQQRDLAERSADASERAELTAQAIGHMAYLAQRQHDDVLFTKYVGEMLALLNAATLTEGISAHWLRGQRQAFAFVLMRANRHDLALPLWEANAASGGHFNSAGDLHHAATVWKLTRDRERTLSLLRDTFTHTQRKEDVAPMFMHRPEFADVREDPDFLQAIGGK